MFLSRHIALKHKPEADVLHGDRDFEVVPVIEMIATEEALKDGKGD